VIDYLAACRIDRRYGARDIERTVRDEIGKAIFAAMGDRDRLPAALHLKVEAAGLVASEADENSSGTLTAITLNTDHPFEDTVAKSLAKGLANEPGYLLTGCHIVNGKERCDIDHILLIQHRGIIVLEDKCYRGSIEGSTNTRWTANGTKAINSAGRLNPRQQVRDYCHILKDYLRAKLGTTFPVWGIIVFPNSVELALADVPAGRIDGQVSAGTLSDIPAMVRQIKMGERLPLSDIISVIR